MNIKIIGSDCSNGIKLKKNLLKVANDYDGDVEIEFKDDQESMKKYNIKNKSYLAEYKENLEIYKIIYELYK